MSSPYDQKLDLPEGKRFLLKRWLIMTDERGFWCQCAAGSRIAILESEGQEYEVTVLFPAAITSLYVPQGEEITNDSFVFQWVTNAEDLPKDGRDFEVNKVSLQPENRRWEQRMVPHLENLAAKMIKSRHFGYLKTVADLLVGLSSPGWGHLSDEDKIRYLEQMKTDFHVRGMGDSEYFSDPDYSAVCELIELEFRAVKRRL